MKPDQAVGRKGEDYVFECEKLRLTNLGRSDLAKKVDDHYRKDEFCGWDITSYNADGTPIYIEVKSTKLAELNQFVITRNEWKRSQDFINKENYYFYFVTKVLTKNPQIKRMKASDLYENMLDPLTYLVRFK